MGCRSSSTALLAVLCSRRLPPIPRLLEPSSRPLRSRGFGVSTSRRAATEGGPDAEAEGQDEGGKQKIDLLGSVGKGRKKGETTLSADKWLRSEEAQKWKYPTPGRPNWLGDDVPFPMNPWFKPPPPLADSVRDKIYASFKTRVQHAISSTSPPSEDVLLRETSQQWGITPKRIEAIVRLKAMEEVWTGQGKVMETHFEKAMESYLGAETRAGVKAGDVVEIENRKAKRKAAFYGIEFVPVDAPRRGEQVIEDGSKGEGRDTASASRWKGYSEDQEPSSQRQITGPDGLPRPPQFWVSRAHGHADIAFRDVSTFPRPKAKEVKKPRASRRLGRR